MDRRLPLLVFVLAFVGLILDANGGPGWGEASARAVLAVQEHHLAVSPLFDLLANVATLLPVGEPGFRLALLAAVIGAATLASVTAAVRALVPKEPAAVLAPIALLAITPAFREAAASPTPALLAACGCAWSIACVARHARAADPDARDPLLALVGCALVIGSAPYLGVVWTLAIVLWLRRCTSPAHLAVGAGALGLFIIALWLTADGRLPSLSGSFAATLEVTGKGPAAIVVGAGLLGASFGALTKLPNARWLGVLVVLVAAHDVVVATPAALVLVCVLAIAIAILPAAIVRIVASDGSARRRNAIAALAAVPLVGAAAATGAELCVEDPGATPAQLARDLSSDVPPGPGVFVSTRSASWVVLDYAAIIAGARPDLALAPPLPSHDADALVANTLRGHRIAAADAAGFGRLDVTRAIPRRRGFQLVGTQPERPSPVTGPATYATAIGREQATLLALERARLEAASERLDLAARAAGLAGTRFKAADLAVLAATTPTREHPALFGLLPLDATPVGPWMFDLFGDDLAWVAGLPIPELPADAPMPRRLHAKWRAILSGTAKPDDPDITTMGSAAVRATQDLFGAKSP